MEANGFIPLMKPRNELDLERPWELDPDRDTLKAETATLRSDKLLAVRPLSSSPDTELTVLAAISWARLVGDNRPAFECERACAFIRASAAAQSETHSWISRSRERAGLSASLMLALR